MKRERLAAIVTVMVFLIVLTVLGTRNRVRPRSTGDDKPSSVVFDLFQRAKEGDVQGYLSCFDAGLRRTVEASKRDMGEAAFRDHIKNLGEAVKGVSVMEERADSREARLRVELVYADRTYNDVQTFIVRKRDSQWRIRSMSRAKPLKMPIPYGTPAYPLELDTQQSNRAAGGGSGTDSQAASGSR